MTDLNRLNLEMLQNNRGHYDLDRYIKEFEGTPKELVDSLEDLEQTLSHDQK